MSKLLCGLPKAGRCCIDAVRNAVFAAGGHGSGRGIRAVVTATAEASTVATAGKDGVLRTPFFRSRLTIHRRIEYLSGEQSPGTSANSIPETLK